MRVYEIAREVGLANKDLLAKIRSLGLEVNNHMSSLDADDVLRIKRSLEKEKQVEKPAETQRLSSTVLRRRSNKEDGDESPSVIMPPVAVPPMVRRRVATDESTSASTATPVAVQTRKSSPVIAAPAAARAVVEEAPPAPAHVEHVAPAPVVVHAAPPEVHAEATPGNGKHLAEETREAPAPAVADRQPPRTRVILNGPAHVARPGQPVVQARSGGHGAGPQVEVVIPRSAPLPPRVTTHAPVVARPAEPTVPQTPEEIAGTARSRFEAELDRARARRVERETVNPPMGEPSDATPEEAIVAAPAEAAAPAAPSNRPAVGSIISLPPRIKITERGPMGRPLTGAPPPSQIRGRFAQQQTRPGGGPGGGGPGGKGGMMRDFGKKRMPLGKKGKQTQLTTPAEHKRVIRIEDTVQIGDLARSMGTKATDVLKKLWGMGMTGVTINAFIDFDTAQILASDFGYEVQNVAFKEEDIFDDKVDADVDMITRAPVVTVMGHVDHGKTSLLDSIRKARVAAGEAGGITQHVAAYKITVPGGHGEVVFLDTPGHEAFSEMRARGAQATDIVVLVVAANDGVMPQTLEALAHAKDAKVSIIVAVNKIDTPDAAPERVRQQLADHGLIPEEWGGETLYVNVSALKHEGIDKLLESIALTAELLQLKANPNKPASGLVIEARLDRNRGPMASVLVQEGTLKVGDIVVAGRTFGKVRALLNDRGESVTEAGPSTPVEVLGLDGVPEAGDAVNAAEDDKSAKTVVEHRRQAWRKRELSVSAKVSLEGMLERFAESPLNKEFKIVLKADVHGSAEALKAALVKQSTDKVKVTVISAGVGGITESDVHLAKAGGAVIIGFHVRPAGKSSKLAEQEGVQIKLYDIIYDALDEVKAAMAGLLAPIKREVFMGTLEVRETFTIPKIGTIAGCMVVTGKITRKAYLRVIRDSVHIYEGKVSNLRRFKDDASEVQQGYECGVQIAGWNDLKQGDIIEAYEVVEEAAKL